ncbi:hypothetical protein SLEP1_g37102 [Rubroshorea leprosula]|uniref:Uncharacterized protein n=1 Tax=Rubroshorea leprosula TaxID=152421 RepID=A0AAV5KTL8_9ROSI|nr:hypothetical protein SLEP1_g37102 [Rubroshorea leprosula]
MEIGFNAADNSAGRIRQAAAASGSTGGNAAPTARQNQ